MIRPAVILSLAILPQSQGDDWPITPESAPKLDESAIVAINDLGPAGKSYTRASLSFDSGRIFAHTIRELICIGK